MFLHCPFRRNLDHVGHPEQSLHHDRGQHGREPDWSHYIEPDHYSQHADDADDRDEPRLHIVRNLRVLADCGNQLDGWGRDANLRRGKDLHGKLRCARERYLIFLHAADREWSRTSCVPGANGGTEAEECGSV